MRLLLDAKDLINVVEHKKPLPITELDTWLRERSGWLVYSLANVRALVAPISLDASGLSRIQKYVEQLERLPHCCISDSSIDLMELRSAMRSFEAGREYEPIDPYVPRFDFVFPPFANPNRLTYRFWDIVCDLWKACPQMFEPPAHARNLLKFAMSMDREMLHAKRPKVAEPPFEPILEFLVLKMSVTRERAVEIASWIGQVPTRCPGLRIIRAVGSAMSGNRTYLARNDDIFDISQTMAIPYVEAMTLDRTMCDYFARAQKALRRAGSPEEGNHKVFRSLHELMQALS